MNSASDYASLEAAANLAVSHVLEKGLDDIFRPPTFPVPIEHITMTANADEFRRFAVSESIKFIKVGDLTKARIGNPQHFLVPKDVYTFRRVHWIDPVDLVKYLTLSILMFPHIESGRVPAHRGIVHSHRRSTDPQVLFDPKYGYDSFRMRSGEISKQYISRWKIITDISNFFDRIGNHFLENHLSSLGCNSTHIRLCREILFQWAGDRRSFGIPVGSDGSRIISEAALIGVDRKLTAAGIQYVRYVDDFRLFADSRAEAYDVIRLLTDALHEDGLALNNKKTQIHRVLSDEAFLEEIPVPAGPQPHEPIDLTRTIETRRTIVSGRSTISRYYREPGRDALKKLQAIPYDVIQNKIREGGLNITEDDVKLCVKYFLYANMQPVLIYSLLEAKITSIFYIVDAIIKESDRIDDQIKSDLSDRIFEIMGGELCPYPYQIPLLRLFSTQGFYDDRLANNVIEGQRITGNHLFFREALLISFQRLDRSLIKRLSMDVYPNAPPLLKRAIYYSTANYDGMIADEKRPLLRNMRQTDDDWFIRNS